MPLRECKDMVIEIVLAALIVAICAPGVIWWLTVFGVLAK